jgi:DNA primase
MTAVDHISAARAVPIETVIEQRGIKLRSRIERIGPCPRCAGTDRFSINTKKLVFNCRQCGARGDVIALVQFLDGSTFADACRMLAGEPPPKANGKDRAARGTVTGEFLYSDESGNTVFAVERHESQQDGKRKKSFRQRRPDPKHPGKWLWNVDGVPVVPYRLPELIEAIAADHPVLVVEGEGKVDLLWSWNIPATCNAGGAKKWRPEHSAFLKDADVVLVPDNDDAGWQHVSEVGASLVGIARRLRVLVLPGLPPKGDIVDWAKAGGTRERLDALLEQAQEWQPLSSSDTKGTNEDEAAKAQAKAREDELIAALAKAQGLDYVCQRKAAAKELGVPA